MKIFKLKRLAKIHAMGFAPDGSLLLSCDQVIRRVDLTSGEQATVVHCGGSPVAFHSNVQRVAVSPVWADLSMLVPRTGVKLVDLRAPQHMNWVSLLRDVRAVYDTVFSSSGEYIAAAYTESTSREGSLRVWQIEGRVLQTLRFPRPVRTVALGADGHFAIAVGYWDRAEVRIYRTDEAAPSCAFVPGRGRVTKVRCAGGSSFVGLSGARLFVARVDETPFVSDPVDRRGVLRDIAVSPCGRFAVTVGDDRRARAWDIASAALISVVDWGIGALTAVAFSPDGLTCAAGGDNGQLVIWDVDV